LALWWIEARWAWSQAAGVAAKLQFKTEIQSRYMNAIGSEHNVSNRRMRQMQSGGANFPAASLDRGERRYFVAASYISAT
jgi:hypothetical protein